MKQLALLSILLSTVFFSYGQKKSYNSSTPQKAMESMNSISEGSPDFEAVSAFYCTKEAQIINTYDHAIIEGRKVFSTFCKLMNSKFPKNVVAFDNTEIEIKPVDSVNKTISFSFSGTSIIEQLVKFKPGSVKYVSETVVDGEIQVKATVNGKEKKFNMKKENDSYKITLPQKELDKLNNAVKLITVSVEKFSKFNEKIGNGEINSQNFSERITQWYQEFIN